MKKILFLIGGITQNNYILNEYNKVLSNLKDGEYEGYQNVFQIDYEKFMDFRYRNIPFYKFLKNLDKHGDWFQFFSNKKLRTEIRSYVYEFILHKCKDLNISTMEVDIYAHSLGTWIVLGAGEYFLNRLTINKLVLFGSPLGSKSKLVKYFVNREVKEVYDIHNVDFINIKSKELFYIYNKDDFVSTSLPNKKVIKHFEDNSDRYLSMPLSIGHNFENYLGKYIDFEKILKYEEN